jgi:hypothetical protein
MLISVPLFNIMLHKRESLSYKVSAPGVDWIIFPIPEIFSKEKDITFLTRPASAIA